MTQSPNGTGFADDAQRYRLDSLIAIGGMGEVWRATDTLLDRPVAVKLLKPEYAGDAVFRSRFEAEGRHAASLHDPGIAGVYDVGESREASADGSPRPYIVMELVEGQPLSSLMRPGEAMEPEVVRDLLAQAGDALGAAHDAGIVHRDVKPANLIVTPERQVKVTDFGISRARAGAQITGTGAVMGTPQYLSPEQARGETASPASDVYGLGVVAFECLMGRRPFDKDTPVATALAHLNDPVPDLPGVDPTLAGIVRRALAKNPAERYADGHQFAAALRMTGETGYVPPVVVQEPVPTQVIAAPAPATALVAEPEDDRTPPLAWLLVVLAVLALVIVALIWFLHSNGSPSPTGPTDAPSDSTSATAPTVAPSADASPVAFDPASYIGKDVNVVQAQLIQLGLKPDLQEIPNPDGDTPGTVARLSPTSGLKQGDTIHVAYYGSATTTSTAPTPTTTRPSPTHSSTPTRSTSSAPTTTPTPTTSAPSTPATPTSSPPATTPAASTTTETTADTPAARKDTP